MSRSLSRLRDRDRLGHTCALGDEDPQCPQTHQGRTRPTRITPNPSRCRHGCLTHGDGLEVSREPTTERTFRVSHPNRI